MLVLPEELLGHCIVMNKMSDRAKLMVKRDACLKMLEETRKISDFTTKLFDWYAHDASLHRDVDARAGCMPALGGIVNHAGRIDEESDLHLAACTWGCMLAYGPEYSFVCRNLGSYSVFQGCRIQWIDDITPPDAPLASLGLTTTPAIGQTPGPGPGPEAKTQAKGPDPPHEHECKAQA
jgi:hypothetical protein